MLERFEIYIVYKWRYINTVPFFSFHLQQRRLVDITWCQVTMWRFNILLNVWRSIDTSGEKLALAVCIPFCHHLRLYVKVPSLNYLDKEKLHKAKRLISKHPVKAFSLSRNHVWGRVPPFHLCSSLVHSLPHLLLFFTLSLFPFLICFTYFLLFSIPSLFTRIVPLLFQAGGRRRRPNLYLVCFVHFVLSVLLS